MTYVPILNSVTGALSFGVVPALHLGGEDLPEAEIRLFRGKHTGPHRGFGARHIWQEHSAAMAKLGLLQESEVSQFVARIVRSGTPLFYEGVSWKTTRLMAVRGVNGQAILEYRAQREAAIWSIVTAFPGTKTHGVRVGTVR